MKKHKQNKTIVKNKKHKQNKTIFKNKKHKQKEVVTKNVENKEIPALEVINFSKKYKGNKEYTVKKACFKVMPGEFHGFIGANGSGKTTTIKSLIGAYAKFEGKINIYGKKHSDLEAKKRVGYIPEVAHFPKRFSAKTYIMYMSYLSGMTKVEAKKFAIKRLKDVGLGALANKSPNSFSSGQKKKVLLAQALVHNPDLIVMDEPAANLDPQARIEFFNNLKFLRKEGKAIFISSHILAELDKYVDAITILDAGKIVYSGPVKEITQNNNMTYRIKTSNDMAVLEYLKELGIKARMSQDKNKILLAELLNIDNIMKVTKMFIEKKIIILEFKNNIISLDEVYENYVKYGSLQTKGKDIKNREAVEGVEND